MTNLHVHVAHTTEQTNMVGDPLWWGALGPGPLTPPKSGTAELYSSFSYFSLGGIGDLFGGTKPNKATLWRQDWLRVLGLGF